MQFSSIYNNTRVCSQKKGILHCYNEHIEFKNGSEENVRVEKREIKNIEWYCVGRSNYQVAIFLANKSTPLKFQGFQENHKDRWEQYVKEKLMKEFNGRLVTYSGVNFGKFKIKSTELQFRSDEDEIIACASYNSFSDVMLQGKREVGVLFKYNPTSRDEEVMTEMRMVIPDNEEDEEKEEVGVAAQEFMSILQHKAKLTVDESTVIAEFSEITFRSPRGKARVRFYKEHMNIRNKNSSNVKYEQIIKLFLFQQPNLNYALVVVLNEPLRQGSTEYRYLVMEFQHESQCELELNIEEDEIEQYALKGKQLIQKTMAGTTHNVVSKILLALAKVKIYTSRNFKSSVETSCVACSFKGNEGMLYPLERSFFFIHKPTLYIKHSEIRKVIFKYEQRTTNLRNFELFLELDSARGLSSVPGSHNSISFVNIKKDELGPMVKFLGEKKLNISNLEKVEELWNSLQSSTGRRRRKAYVPGAMAGLDAGAYDEPDDDESPDEDYDEGTDMNMLEEDENNEEEYYSDREVNEPEESDAEESKEEIEGSGAEETKEELDDEMNGANTPMVED